MLTRFTRVLILLAAAGVTYAGPLAACLCAVAATQQMPCCPDDAQQLDQSVCMQPDSAASVTCDPVATDLLSTGTYDLAPPIAFAATQLPSFVHDPPTPSIAIAPPPHASPPIYLTTLRLRI